MLWTIGVVLIFLTLYYDFIKDDQMSAMFLGLASIVFLVGNHVIIQVTKEVKKCQK